jgi:hypothetical protein
MWLRPAHDEVFMTIHAPKDFWSGVMFVAFAAVALIAARNYSLGDAGHMGPGYFPILLGVVLAFIGLLLVARAVVMEGERVGKFQLWPLAVIAFAVCVFGATIEVFGLAVALVLVTMISALASRESRLLESVGLAFVMAAFSVGIFAYVLRLPLPVWPWFYG